MANLSIGSQHFLDNKESLVRFLSIPIYLHQHLQVSSLLCAFQAESRLDHLPDYIVKEVKVVIEN